MNRFNKLIIIALTLYGLNIADAKSQTIVASGTSGNLNWQVTDDSVLTISGSGEMLNYTWNSKPWYAHKDKIIRAIVENGVSTIGNGAFSRLDKLKNVQLSNTITSIGDGVFSLCSQLVEITIPDAVNAIGNYVFTNCSGLSMITVDATTPPSISSYTFDGVYANIPILVSCMSLSNYQNALFWNYFTNYIVLSEDTVTINASICTGEIYTDNGFNESEAGTYYISDNCDVVKLNLTHYPQSDTNFIIATINYDETYTENGFNESEAGTYQLTLQDMNGCDSIIILNLVVLENSLNDVGATRLNVYPNPTHNKLIIEGESYDKVIIYDIYGRTIVMSNDIKGIDIIKLPNGAYNVSIISYGKATVRKSIIKQ